MTTNRTLKVSTTHAQLELRDQNDVLFAVITTYKQPDARRLAACWNVCQGFNTDVLESIIGLGESMLTRFQARDRVEAVLIADRLKAMQERDRLRALVLQMRSALQDCEKAIGGLNDANQATGRALEASEHLAPPPPASRLRPTAPPAPARCTGGLPQCTWVGVPGGGSKCTTCGESLPF